MISNNEHYRIKPYPATLLASDAIATGSFDAAFLLNSQMDSNNLAFKLAFHNFTASPFTGGPFGGLCLNLAAASNQYVDTPTVPETSSWTISVWARAASLPAAGMTLIANSSAAATDYQYYMTVGVNGNIECGTTDSRGGGAAIFSDAANGTVTAGGWHHYLATSDGSGNNSGAFKIYFDGASMSLTDSGTSGTLPLTSNCGATAIGIFGDAHSSPWDGQIDHVFIMNGVVDANTREMLYSNPFRFFEDAGFTEFGKAFTPGQLIEMQAVKRAAYF